MRSGVLIGVVLLLVAGAVLVARFAGGPGRVAEQAVPATSERAVAPGERSEALPRAQPWAARGERSAPRAEPAESAREQVVASAAAGGPELSIDSTLEVRVVDRRGRPVAGIDVVVVHDAWNGASQGARRAKAEGPAAIARFPDIQETLRGGAGTAWRVALDALLEEGGEQALDPDALPLEPVTLVLPATGSVEVRVIDEAGALAADVGEVTLGIVREGEPRRISPFSHVHRSRHRAPAKGGVARFAHVGLGLELEVIARREASEVESVSYGTGPTRAGHRAVFELQLGADHPVLVGRAVDELGAPLSEEALTARFERRSRHLSDTQDSEVRTDAAGRFRVDLAGDWVEGTTRTLSLMEGSADEPSRSVTVDLSRELQNGMNELGDLLLEPPGVFVAGRVVDQAGDGVPGAQLTLQRRSTGDDWWEEERGFEHRADGAGWFEARGAWAAGTFRLIAGARTSACPPVEFAPGETKLVLTMRATGSIAGSVLLDEGIDRELIRVHVRSSDEAAPLDYLDWTERSVELDGTGAFRFPRLLPAGYTVRVSIERVGTPLFEAAGVAVVAEEEALDPRLQEIDLRGALHQIQLHIVGPERSRSLRGVVRYGPAGSGEYQHRLSFFFTPVKLLVPQLPLDVSVEVAGFRRAQLESVAEDREVRVERGPTVRVVLTGAAPIPEPPYFIKVSIVPLDGEPAIDWGAPAFDERRELDLRAPDAGPMRVQWIVERRAENGAVATMADLGEPQLVEVLEQASGQVVEVPLDQAGLETLLAALD